MAEIQISSIRKRNGDVFIKVDDMIKAMYRDITNLSDDDTRVKEFLKFSIENWEEYQEKIRNKDI